MPDKFLKAGDTVNGQEGKAIAIVDGRVEDLFMVKKFDATAEKQKASIRTLGKRSIQHKGNGWEGKISMDMYYCSSLFRRLMLDYMKTGIDTYFDITIINSDPGSTVGSQSVTFLSVNLDKVPLALLNTDDPNLVETVDATFDDAEMLDEFDLPSNMR